MLTKQELAKFHKLVNDHNPRLDLVFSVLSEPNRCKIFRMAVQPGNENLCVGDFAQILNISAAAASQHLKQMEVAGILLKERRGQKVYFRAQTKDPLVTAITKAISN